MDLSSCGALAVSDARAPSTHESNHITCAVSHQKGPIQGREQRILDTSTVNRAQQSSHETAQCRATSEHQSNHITCALSEQSFHSKGTVYKQCKNCVSTLR